MFMIGRAHARSVEDPTGPPIIPSRKENEEKISSAYRPAALAAGPQSPPTELDKDMRVLSI